VNNVSMRRTINVAEMVGWDKKKNDFKLNEIFRWDAKKDVYNKVGKSHLLKQIASQMGFTDKDTEEELRKRKIILDYMVLKNIRSYEDVSKLVLDYFAEPEKVYRRAKVS
jgi:flagellar protein FlaI